LYSQEKSEQLVISDSPLQLRQSLVQKKEIKKECKDHGDDEDENRINIVTWITES